jgi:protein-disulfide isomerase
MNSRFWTMAAGPLLALLALLVAPACSKQGAAPGGKTTAQADMAKTVELAKKSIEKFRFSMQASPKTKIEVLDARPSKVPGFARLKLRVSKDNRSAIRLVMVTTDLRYVVRGEIIHLGEVPRLRVDLENVHLKDAPTRGNPAAPVTIVEYADFQCPYCRAMEPVVTRALHEYEGQVKFVFRHYPIRSHVWAYDAALLSECARRQKPELFWKLHDFYYKTEGLTLDNILAKTQEQLKPAKIDIDKFNKCYLEKEPDSVLNASVAEAKIIGVRGTPAFLVDDVFLSGTQPYALLSSIILEELKREGHKPPSAAARAPKAG